ncbi:hypothetical protein VNO77_22532 [Canavalia gladiata]|uniref:Uncharacterized protein n=1 Tax=Canavalia gladiata TaxID=3824 RepID=A0AAN9L3Q5_CANGL
MKGHKSDWVPDNCLKRKGWTLHFAAGNWSFSLFICICGLICETEQVFLACASAEEIGGKLRIQPKKKGLIASAR